MMNRVMVLVALLISGCIDAPGTPPAATQGDFLHTESVWDIAIEDAGRSYFVLTDKGGTPYFTRHGAFEVDNSGAVVHSRSGHALSPRLTITSDMTDIAISADGRVTAKRQSTNNIEPVGEIVLARFSDPGGLVRSGDGMFMSSQRSGAPSLGRPGRDGFGALAQGYLEASAM